MQSGLHAAMQDACAEEQHEEHNQVCQEAVQLRKQDPSARCRLSRSEPAGGRPGSRKYFLKYVFPIHVSSDSMRQAGRNVTDPVAALLLPTLRLARRRRCC